MLLFSRIALEIQARGIPWPTGWDDQGKTSQKDLLLRCQSLLENAEKVKRAKARVAAAVLLKGGEKSTASKAVDDSISDREAGDDADGQTGPVQSGVGSGSDDEDSSSDEDS